jgi:hypothetical protein
MRTIVRKERDVNTVRMRAPPYESVDTIPERMRNKFSYVLDNMNVEEQFRLSWDDLHAIEIDFSNMQRWYSLVSDFTASSIFIHLDPSEIKHIRTMQTLCMGRGFETRDYQEFTDLIYKLNSHIKPGSHQFFKLSSVSPKDIRDIPCYDETVQYYRAHCTSKGQYRKLCVHSSEEIIYLLMNSERLYATLKTRPNGHYIVLREWIDADPELEFRCFIYDGHMTAISQYHSQTGYRFTSAEALSYAKQIQVFYTKIKPKLMNTDNVVKDWVLDVGFKRDNTPFIVELNGFGAHMITGSAQYCWELDYDLIYRSSGCTVRHLVNKYPSPDNPDEEIMEIAEQDLPDF